MDVGTSVDITEFPGRINFLEGAVASGRIEAREARDIAGGRGCDCARHPKGDRDRATTTDNSASVGAGTAGRPAEAG